MKVIELKYPATCADAKCGKALAAGSKAKWYGKGRVYGIGCHEKPEGIVSRVGGRRVVERAAANYNGRPCNCEDYPCCGCGVGITTDEFGRAYSPEFLEGLNERY